MDLFRMAEVHQILPMIYEAVYRSPAAGQADPQILAPAKAQMVRTVIMQTQKTGEFEPLYRYLRESGICPLVVKGSCAGTFIRIRIIGYPEMRIY